MHCQLMWQKDVTVCLSDLGFSIDLNFQDVMTSMLKKFGRQCTKSGSHAAGLQEYLSKKLMQNSIYVTMYAPLYAPPT